MIAAKELEDAASKYASTAIRFDSQGSRGLAVQMYQRAIQSLITLAKIYPDYKLNKLYIERATTYQGRIKALQDVFGQSPIDSSDGPNQFDRIHRNSKAPKMVEPLKASYNDLVMQDKPNVSWDDVVGLDNARQSLTESIIYPVQRPDLFPLGWPRGFLLYGPPGCGKTMLAAAASAEIDASFINVDAASIMSKWLGEAERNVAKLFNSSRKMLENDVRAVIIFVDELDSLLGTRNQEVGGEIRVKNQFLKEMDGLTDKGKNLHLYVIGATNKPWALDWPFLRRFQKRIYVPIPSLSSRMEMLKHYTSPLNLHPDVKLDDLSTITEGYSGSDIRDICQSIQIKVVTELFASGKGEDKTSQTREITTEDAKAVLKNRKPSVSHEMINAYSAWSEKFKAL